MTFKNHHHYTSDPTTDRMILTCVFLTIGVLVAVGVFAHLVLWLPYRSERQTHIDDVEACQPLLTKDTPTSDHTFPTPSQTSFAQHSEIRRVIRHERILDNVSGTYQISVRRIDDDDVSLSSDNSLAESEGAPEYVVREGIQEEDKESSESESGSSDNSDSDSDEIMEIRQLLDTRRVLPKKVTTLRDMKE